MTSRNRLGEVMVATHRPINLRGLYWIECGHATTFEGSRPGFGVEVIATGEVLARDGVQPSAWRTKEAAQIIAEYADSMTRYRPVRVFRSVQDASAARTVTR